MKYPLLLKPHLEHPIWSGKKLAIEFNKDDNNPIGECWEMSTINGKESVVSNGIYKDVNLSEFLDKNLNFTLKGQNRLDLLFKLIDTDDKLSIQVHPDNEFAKLYENQNGKTEAWYIVDCDKDAFIYLGFNKDLTTDEVKNCIKNKGAKTLWILI
jgi:mannose-6-phosphate isomerase